MIRIEKVTWVCMDNPPGYRKPRWMRSAAIREDGTVFAPAAMADHENAAVLKAAWDGSVPCLVEYGHIYLPTWWISREYPDVADVCECIEARLKRCV